MTAYDSSPEGIARLQERIQTLLQKKAPGGGRVVVAVAGIPGSGKSTLVEKLARKLESCGVEARVLPQDGYHFYREQLARFEDPAEAFRRRGAPYTFDAASFVSTVKAVREGATTVWAPSFDHAKKDPVERDICIEASAKVVFVEGNYVGLTDEPWSELATLADELWMISTSPEIVRERLVRRHLEAGIAKTLEEAEERAGGSDWDNAVYVMSHSREPDAVVSMDTLVEAE